MVLVRNRSQPSHLEPRRLRRLALNLGLLPRLPLALHLALPLVLSLALHLARRPTRRSPPRRPQPRRFWGPRLRSLVLPLELLLALASPLTLPLEMLLPQSALLLARRPTKRSPPRRSPPRQSLGPTRPSRVPQPCPLAKLLTAQPPVPPGSPLLTAALPFPSSSS